MVELILTVCISAASCDDYALDTFDTMKECNDDRIAFIVERRIPPSEAGLLSCKRPVDTDE